MLCDLFLQLLFSSMSSNQCGVCNQPSTLACGGCKQVYYCSKEHQKDDWKAHKSVCKSASASSGHSHGAHAEAHGHSHGTITAYTALFNVAAYATASSLTSLLCFFVPRSGGVACGNQTHAHVLFPCAHSHTCAHAWMQHIATLFILHMCLCV